MRNKNLIKAKEVKNDEFYTLYEDIEREVAHYEDFLRGKVIYCPCDDPEWSNFWKFFKDNFHRLGLKELISTYYDATIPTGVEAFFEESTTKVYKTIFDGETITRLSLDENGDFRSQECVWTLREADVVITNPPFSLFRELVALLMKEKKDFLLIGNQNDFTLRGIFPLLRDRRISLGYNYGSFFFSLPNSEELRRFGCICWFTTLPTKDKPFLPLTKSYDESVNIRYENYDAINVDKISDIPYDYYETMGVPITFFYKWNPEQFSIVGSSKDANCYLKNALQFGTGKPIPSGKINLYRRFVEGYDEHPSFINDGVAYIHVYGRIFIRRRTDI